jgi:hypothetical protein
MNITFTDSSPVRPFEKGLIEKNIVCLVFVITAVSQLKPLNVIEKIQNNWDVIGKIKFHENKRRKILTTSFLHCDGGQASRNML